MPLTTPNSKSTKCELFNSKFLTSKFLLVNYFIND